MNLPILSKNVIKKLFSNIGLKLARACPNFRPILLKNNFDSPPQFNGEFPSYFLENFFYLLYTPVFDSCERVKSP